MEKSDATKQSNFSESRIFGQEQDTEDFSALSALLEGKELPEKKDLEQKPVDETGGEETAKAEEEPKPQTEPEEEPEAEVESEVEPEKEPEIEPEKEEPKPVGLSPEMKSLFPDAEDEKAVITSINAIKEELEAEKDANREMYTILEAHPSLVNILRDVKNGMPLFEAMRQHLEIEGELPDPATDPAGYSKLVEKQAALKLKKQNDAEKKSKNDELAKKAQDKAIADRAAFQKKQGLTDAEMKKFDDFLTSMIYGNPHTFMLPDDFFERMYKSYKYEENVEEIKKKAEADKKKAELDARNAGIDQVKGKAAQRGDGLPDLKSGTAKPKKKDDLDRLAESFNEPSRIFGP